MRLFTYDKNSIEYKRYRLKLKYVLIFIVTQLILSFLLLLFLSIFYVTPREKKLKADITYLVTEFNNANKRIAENQAIINQVQENDSIVYKTIFDIDDIHGKEFDAYYDSDVSNDYLKIVEETNKKITILEQKTAKEMYSLSGIIKTAAAHQDMLTHMPAIQPIDNKDLKRTASGWGYRIHPIYKIRRFHYGLDFTAPTNTPVYATGDGVVQYAISAKDKASQGYGNVIIIDHGYSFKTLYAHLNKFNVKPGQKVVRGQIIAFVGSTGLSTGPHLHYEVIENGKKVNPIYYFFNSLNAEDYEKIIKISNSKKKSYD